MQESGHNPHAHQKPKQQEETQLQQRQYERRSLQLVAHRHSRQQYHDHNAKNVLQNEYRHHLSGKPSAHESHVIESLVDDGRTGHGQHTAYKHTVYRRPTHQIACATP